MALSFPCLMAGCKKTTPTTTRTPPVATIAGVRALEDIHAASGATVTIPDGYSITGAVISSIKEEDSNTVYIQDSTGGRGLKIRFDAHHTYNVGDIVQVYIARQQLSIVQNDYQLTNVPLIYANKTGTGPVTGRPATVETAIANFDQWSSSLVKFPGMRTAGQTSDSTFLLKDSSTGRTIPVLISPRLNYTLPDSLMSITGYLCKVNGDVQLRIRTSADVIQYPVRSKVIENFDIGSYPNYASGDQTYTGFVSGKWVLNDALVANDPNADLIDGTGSIRIRGKSAPAGYLYTAFDMKGLNNISFRFGGSKNNEGADSIQQTSIQVFISKDAGTTWTSVGNFLGKHAQFAPVVNIPVSSLPADNLRVKFLNTSFLRSSGAKIRIDLDDVAFTLSQ